MPNCSKIYDDLIFFLNESKKISKDQEISKRYSRVALIYLAFYFESLSNLFKDEVGKRFNCLQNLELELDYNRNNHPEALRKFQAIYCYLFMHDSTYRKFPLNTDGIDDLFLLRNHIFCHPPDKSIIGGTNVINAIGLNEKGKNLSFKKFKHFPNIYREITIKHTQEVYYETKDFLLKYHYRVKKKLSELVILYYLKIL